VNARSKKLPSPDKGNYPSQKRYEFGLRALYALRRIIRAVDIDSRKLVSEHKITGPQLLCLMKVVENEKITATEIGKSIHLSSSTVVGILDRLEKKGLVTRERDIKDRRVVGIIATDAGRALVMKVPYPLRHPLHNALGELSAKDQEAVISLLERLVEIMDAQDLAKGPVVVSSAINGPDKGLTPPPG
jgi:DNA-binding MarR family transcriptional regulator